MQKQSFSVSRVAALVLAITIAGTLPSLGQADAPPRERGQRAAPGGPGGAGADRLGQARAFRGGLNLDDKQRDLLRQAMQEQNTEIRNLNEKLQTAQKALVQAVTNEKYDEKVVREKAEAVSKIQTDLTVLRAKAFSSVVPSLTQEQREQIDNSPFAASMILGGGGMGMAGGIGAGRGEGPGAQERPVRRENAPGAPAGERGERRREGRQN